MPSTINADNGVVSGSAGLKSSADSSGVLSLQTNGTTAVTVDTSQNVGVGTASPGYRVDAQTSADAAINVKSTGTIQSAYVRIVGRQTSVDEEWNVVSTGSGLGSPALRFVRGTWTGTPSMLIDSSGNLLVGATSATSRLLIVGSGATSATNNAIFLNSSSTNLFTIRNDGYTYAPYWYNTTTASAANVFVDTNGGLLRSTSSLKYKTNVQDAKFGLADVLKLRAVTYQGKNDGNTVFGGLIAEEVHEAGLTEFVQYAKDGSPDALHYGHMVSLCIKAIQELNAKVQALESQLAAKG